MCLFCNDQHGVNYFFFLCRFFSVTLRFMLILELFLQFYGVHFFLPLRLSTTEPEWYICHLKTHVIQDCICVNYPSRRWWRKFFFKVNYWVFVLYLCLIQSSCSCLVDPVLILKGQRLPEGVHVWLCEPTRPPLLSKKRRNSSMYSTKVLFFCSS